MTRGMDWFVRKRGMDFLQMVRVGIERCRRFYLQLPSMKGM